MMIDAVAGGAVGALIIFVLAVLCTVVVLAHRDP